MEETQLLKVADKPAAVSTSTKIDSRSPDGDISTSFFTIGSDTSESDSGINMSSESETYLIGPVTGSPLSHREKRIQISSTPIADSAALSPGGEVSEVDISAVRGGTSEAVGGDTAQRRIFNFDMDNLPDVYVTSSTEDRGRDYSSARPVCARNCVEQRHRGSFPSDYVGDVSGRSEQNSVGYLCACHEVSLTGQEQMSHTCHEEASRGTESRRTRRSSESSVRGWEEERLLEQWRQTPRSSSAPTIVEHVVALELRSISDSFNSLYEGSDIDQEVPFTRDSRRSSLPLLGAFKKSKSLLDIIRRYLPSRSQAVATTSSSTDGSYDVFIAELEDSASEELTEDHMSAHERAKGAARAQRRFQVHRSSFSSVPEDNEPNE